MGARLIQVIETDLECRGKGIWQSPFRLIRQWWLPDGTLLAESDPSPPSCRREKALEDLLRDATAFLRAASIAWPGAVECDDGLNLAGSIADARKTLESDK